jgi:hypothetical protein
MPQRKAGDRLKSELVPSDAPMTHGGEGGTKGSFTREASKRGKSVQEFAAQVKRNPENYTPGMRKKANFAANASKWG